MRLLNVKTLQLHEYFGGSDLVPHYAILSHRWEKEEVTFQDFGLMERKDMYGWKKITGCCMQVVNDGLEFVWIDSCCIDKSSSAEVSEAINSMFRWYQDAEICYAYLSDLVPQGEYVDLNAFQASKWFRRGWTLQELLAPHDLRFFDSGWKDIGTKESLELAIKSTTGIQYLFSFEEASIAQKMSWAAERETTRVEDRAYCLMGIFGVNMPPLYGEGQNAFLRLQLEIMKNNNDESLFAWTDDSRPKSGLLAASPTAFKDSGSIKSLNPQWLYRPPYSMTNKGLQIQFNFAELRLNVAELQPKLIAPLNCAIEGDQTSVVALLLANDGLSEVGFTRASCGTLNSYDRDNTRDLQPRAALYIREPQIASGTSSRCYFRINTRQMRDSRVEVKELHLSNPDLGHWSKASETGYTLRLCNTNALIVFEKDDDRFILRISSEEGSSCLHLIVRQSDNPVTVTEILHLRKEPPVLPHWSHLSGQKCYITVHADQIRKALPSGKAVDITFHKAENRPQFEIEVSLLPSYVPVVSKVFPLPMTKMKPTETDYQISETEVLSQERDIHSKVKDVYLSAPRPTPPRAISPAKPVSTRPPSDYVPWPRQRQHSPGLKTYSVSTPLDSRLGQPYSDPPAPLFTAEQHERDTYIRIERERQPYKARPRDGNVVSLGLDTVEREPMPYSRQPRAEALEHDWLYAVQRRPERVDRKRLPLSPNLGLEKFERERKPYSAQPDLDRDEHERLPPSPRIGLEGIERERHPYSPKAEGESSSEEG